MPRSIKVSKYNESYVRVDGDQELLYEIADEFSFEIPNAKFHPLVKKGKWDGYIRKFNMREQLLPLGLTLPLTEMYDPSEVKFVVSDGILDRNDFTDQDVLDFHESLATGRELRPYQIDYIREAVNARRVSLVSPTASGKSLIIYVAIMMLLHHELISRVILIVPRVSLVHQMRSDMIDYGIDPGMIHLIYSGQDKLVKKPLTITTWQSLPKKARDGSHLDYYEPFDALFIDEVHEASKTGKDSKVIQEICDACVNASYRIGTTGSLDGNPLNTITLTGMIGPPVQFKKTVDLMREGYLSNLTISLLILQYPSKTVDALTKIQNKESNFKKNTGKNKGQIKYMLETEFIVNNKKRTDFIARLALTREGNTLVTFKFVNTEKKPHGRLLYERIEELNTDDSRKIFFVHGGTDTEIREQIRSIVETEDNAIIVASEGVFAMGINIQRLHHLIPANGGKSIITIIQSIGRILRKTEDSTKAYLYDVADDLEYSKRHMIERLKIYNSEGFRYKTFTKEVE